jgi:hypothetical protein
MTNSMTCQELNEIIAKKRGYKFQYDNGEYKKLWRDPKGDIVYEGDFPDYCNSWEFAGELLGELIQKMNLFKIVVFLDEVDHRDVEVFLLNGAYLTLTWHKSDNKCRKIAEAWNEVNP